MLFLLLCCTAAMPLQAQQRADTLSKARRDSIAAADSVRLVREFEQLQRGDSASSRPSGGASGPTNPRLMPDISAVSDFLIDASPKGGTLGDRSKRADVREIEIAIQAAVDPYFRGDIFLGISDEEKIAIEQAFLTTTSLPGGWEVKVGRFLMPVSKLNLTHREALHTIEYPWAMQQFFTPEGLKGTGVWAARVFAPFGFFQELNVTVVDRFGERDESLQTTEPANKRFSGLTYSARLRNYVDITKATNIELSGTALTGRREQPIAFVTAPDALAGVTAVSARQSLFSVDATLRWRPLAQGLYRSFVAQAEIMVQRNETRPALPIIAGDDPVTYLGPDRNRSGGFVYARWQLRQRTFVGGRYDQLSGPNIGAPAFKAASGYLEFFPSDFSKLVLGYERILGGGEGVGFDAPKVDRILAQAVFALGPHKPHPF